MSHFDYTNKCLIYAGIYVIMRMILRENMRFLKTPYFDIVFKEKPLLKEVKKLL